MLDAMILLGVVAVGFGLGRAALRLRYGGGEPDGWRAVEVVVRCASLLMAAVLAVPLLGRRGAIRGRIGRHAGAAVVAAVLIALLMNALKTAPFFVEGLGHRFRTPWPRRLGIFFFRISNPREIAPAVVASWVAVMALDRPRRAFDWLDRLGRIVGVGWIALFLGDVIAFLADALG